MWFKNLQLYRIDPSFDLDAEGLEQRLQKQVFQTCSSMDLSVSGWSAPLGRNAEQLVHSVGHCMMVCARKAEKVIPAAIVKELVDEKVADIEASEVRDVKRREKLRIKDEIVIDLLPRALVKNSDTFAYFDLELRLLVVDSSSASKAEDLITLMRHTLGSFSAMPVKLQHAPGDFMTRWVSGEHVPEGFVLGEECELKHPNPDGGTVTCKGQDLTAGEVRNHVNQGKFVTRIALLWEQRLSFVMHEDLSIKKVKFEDIIKDAMDEVDADDAASRFDLDFSIMTLEYARFIPALIELFGGEEVQKAQAA